MSASIYPAAGLAAPMNDHPAMEDDQGTLLTLDPDTVLGMADAAGFLFVQGDAEDAVALRGDWTKSDDTFRADDGIVYDCYVAQTGQNIAVTLYIDRGVTTQT